jgi:hypothetical protein
MEMKRLWQGQGHTTGPWKKPRLILGFRVLAEEPTGATIGPMFDSRSCLSLKASACFDGGHHPSADTNHGFAADDQSGHFDR